MIRIGFLTLVVLWITGQLAVAQTDPAVLYAQGKQAYDCNPETAAGWIVRWAWESPTPSVTRRQGVHR